MIERKEVIDEVLKDYDFREKVCPTLSDKQLTLLVEFVYDFIKKHEV